MKDLNKSLIALLLLIVGLAIFWFIFRPVPDKGEPAPGQTTQSSTNKYVSTDLGFSADVPPNYTVKEGYYYQALGPNSQIPGVAFVIPEAAAAGTNLSKDSYVSVEKLSDVACTPADFLQVKANSGVPTTLGAYQYTMAITGDAGAGNLYDETIYVRKQGSDCFGIRFYVHSTQFANYPAGSITQFDKSALIDSFKGIAATVTYN